MYRHLITGAILLLVGTGLYFFHQSGASELVANDIERGGKGHGVDALEVFSGAYICDETSGCQGKTKLILEKDTTLDINYIDENGQEANLGQGTWGIGSNGAAIFLLQTLASSTYPKSLTANKVSIMKISGFSNKKKLFPGMKDPVFTRIKNNDEVTGVDRGEN
jgi:hypothetical protein